MIGLDQKAAHKGGLRSSSSASPFPNTSYWKADLCFCPLGESGS